MLRVYVPPACLQFTYNTFPNLTRPIRQRHPHLSGGDRTDQLLRDPPASRKT